jgi:phosphoglycolate phosphatase-like HAD superfamily hydrolase
LLLALVDLGVDPGQGIYVGDTHIDQEAARRAGLDFIHAGWGYGQPEPPLPQLAQAPEDLLRLLPTGETRSAFAARSTQ